jgi:hypothetical protein
MYFVPQTFQAFDENNQPLAFGYLWVYKSGTDTPCYIYKDVIGGFDYYGQWPIQLDATGSASFWLNNADAPVRFNVTDVDNKQMPNYPVDNVLLLSPPVVAWTIGLWNEAHNWEAQAVGTDSYPGPFGVSDPTRYWDTNSIPFGNSNGAECSPPPFDYGIKSETVYLRLSNGSVLGTGCNAQTVMGVDWNDHAVPPGEEWLYPYQRLSDLDTYLALDPTGTPGSTSYFDYTMILYTEPTMTNTIEIPFRHYMAGW